MKDITARELIEKLQKCNQDAIVCIVNYESASNDAVKYIKEWNDVLYYPSSGDGERRGNIVCVD